MGTTLSAWSGSPDITLTIGQAPFQSLVSMQEEQRPVALNIVARPGCELVPLLTQEDLANRQLHAIRLC
jgi:hypothetical protein